MEPTSTTLRTPQDVAAVLESQDIFGGVPATYKVEPFSNPILAAGTGTADPATGGFWVKSRICTLATCPPRSGPEFMM